MRYQLCYSRRSYQLLKDAAPDSIEPAFKSNGRSYQLEQMCRILESMSSRDLVYLTNSLPRAAVPALFLACKRPRGR